MDIQLNEILLPIALYAIYKKYKKAVKEKNQKLADKYLKILKANDAEFSKESYTHK